MLEAPGYNLDVVDLDLPANWIDIRMMAEMMNLLGPTDRIFNPENWVWDCSG